MAVRQINILKIVNEIIKYTDDTLPDAMSTFADIMIEKSAEMWNIKAKKAGGWGRKYASTLKVEYSNSGTARVYADEKHKNYKYVEMVEEGVKTWSIKKALLAGKAARRNLAEHGSLFVRVPFRHRSPGKTKRTSSFASVLSNTIYQQAKSGKSIGATSNIATRKLEHLAGLKRYGGEKHGKYFTFRTVSEKSKGWQYPDKPAIHIFDEVVDKTEEMIRKSIIKMAKGFSQDIEKKFK